MPDETTEKIEDLKKQILLVQQQQTLLTTQFTLEKNRQIQDAELAKAIAESLKSQATAQYSLASEQAKLPLAELAGVKAALGGAQIPTGKTGTFQIDAGKAGTALIQSKMKLMALLGTVVNALDKEIEETSLVIVTEAQLDQAFQAGFMDKRIDDQQKALEHAITTTKSTLPAAAPMIFLPLPQFAATAYSLGFVLDTVNNLTKLFRTDVKAEVFAADAEAAQLLGWMLESRNGTKYQSATTMDYNEVVEYADGLLTNLNNLSVSIQEAESLIPRLRATDTSDIKRQIEGAKSLVEGLHVSKKPDIFWSQVKGHFIFKKLELPGKASDSLRLLFLDVKAQTLRITESHWYCGDSVYSGAEIQVNYRIASKDGKLTKAGVIIKMSKQDKIKWGKEEGDQYPPAPPAK